MNREIKFRAWLKYDKVMLGWELIASDRETRKGNANLQDCFRNERVILMQYTGLKDKSGKSVDTSKEIYEGDIVKHQNGFMYIVKFSPLNSWFYLYQPHDGEGNPLEEAYTGGINGQKMWRCKVIGNIYENPELLK